MNVKIKYAMQVIAEYCKKMECAACQIEYKIDCNGEYAIYPAKWIVEKAEER